MAEKIKVNIDPELKDIIPNYLENRRKDLAAMPGLLKDENFEALRVMGHKLRGSGGGYGLHFLTAFGGRLETAAIKKDKPAIEALAEELGAFLDALELDYGGPGQDGSMAGKNIIKVDPDLKDLVPVYLENTREHLAAMPQLLKEGRFDDLWAVGHKLHGSGGGYGLDFLTGLGERLEAAAKKRDKPAIEAQIKELADFLDSLIIEYTAPA